MAELLHKLYYDPKTGYVGIQKLYEKARAIDKSITVKAVKERFSNQVDIQRYQEQKPHFTDFVITNPNPDSWQIDLTFWPDLGTKPILTAVNINSRIGYAKILGNKQANTVLTALKAFVKKYKPRILTSDNGVEFMNRSGLDYLKQQEIEHYNNEPGDHSTMGKIERFNRTLKQRLMKMDRKLTSKLVDDVVYNYNNTDHRVIGMTPTEAKGTVIQAELDHNKEAMQRSTVSLVWAAACCISSRKSHSTKKGRDGARLCTR